MNSHSEVHVEDLCRVGEADATASCSRGGLRRIPGDRDLTGSQLTCIFRQPRECSRVTVAHLARASSCGHTSSPAPESTPESSDSTGGAPSTGDEVPCGGKGCSPVRPRKGTWLGGRSRGHSESPRDHPYPGSNLPESQKGGPSDEWWPRGSLSYSVPGTVPGTGDTSGNKIRTVPDLPWEQISKRGFGLAVSAIP